ncbi:bifunctional tetrahydrofolate synthase/dihydrofolate synthase [Aliiglaciecola sp. CAU 1673]|uniref:bifunctional tetrahydrofolate synthase/dihydrofolate synthase n=1 Tax=Aliiglaciecola sp. CAU 1673 TaxID=3032595 RepID=UPI0023D9D823|nr:bifunctional tetrahydrofolate synthase/dihydrofolate synthase [Aliiglaciecola sp. CAU 1673]MDF2178057.1 bifunctional tetrahydrofolate synthase/dihydrofolate synthase [Aliiglaciecola sp. CAU 1673]
MPSSVKSQPSSLEGWLSYLESIHPASIEMGLERIRRVYDLLQLDLSATRVITVAGTNGKGTTCAMLEQAMLQLGQSVAVYSSPHIVDYRERLRVNGAMLDEPAHCQAFAAVEKARGDISLTYFEFGTLAALYLIALQKPQNAILEVGLGGRLDAVNIVEPDLSIITTIDLDHQDWLGDSREKIAIEKAGIVREGGRVVIGEPNPPQSLKQRMGQLHANALWRHQDFDCQVTTSGFQWQGMGLELKDAPVPNIPAANAATAVAALAVLGLYAQLDMPRLFQDTRLPGRCQLIQRSPDVLLDVGHNPEAVRYLVSQLTSRTWQQLHLVVGMLKDKDIAATLAPLSVFDANWYLAPLPGPRGATTKQLLEKLPSAQSVIECSSVIAALNKAKQAAGADDLILVFGSFLTVAEVLAAP